MTEEKLNGWVRRKIRSLDTVRSTGTLTVVRPEDKREEPIDKSLIIDDEEEERWGPWR